MGPINAAITQLNDDPASAFNTPSGRGCLKAHKVRTLVAHGVSVAAGGPTPLPAELRSVVSTPDVISEKIRVMEEQLRLQRQEVADSKAEIVGLQKVQDAIDADRDVTADSPLHPSTLHQHD
jgi:hypothetical protein